MPVALLCACAGAVAVAFWLLPASLHVVAWEGDRARVLALLPPGAISGGPPRVR